MDWETSFRLLTSEINRSSQTDLDMASIALINAMDFYKSFPFDFNHGFEAVHLPAGQEILSSPDVPFGFPVMRTGMPYGIKRPIMIQITALVSSGDVFVGTGPFTYQPTGGNPLKQISVEEMAAFHQGVGNNRTTVGGYPEYFAWHTDGTVRIFPVPFTDMLASVYFVKDAMRPRYRWATSVWTFERLKESGQVDPDNPGAFWEWVEMEPEFTNMWLTYAEPLIRARARLDLYMNFYHDAGASQIASASMREQENRYHLELQSGMAGTNPRRASSL